MAGFGDSTNSKTSKSLSTLSRFGTRYEDLLLKNSKAIGFIEGQLSARSDLSGSSTLRSQSRHYLHVPTRRE
jgi:hypothetical protein